jgi:hypothetical protein
MLCGNGGDGTRVGLKGPGTQKTGQPMVNVIGILACYALIVILTMPDDFAMPRDDEDWDCPLVPQERQDQREGQ